MKYFLASLLIISFSANADVIYLKNGDRITGEIKTIWDDDVSIEPAYSDTFKVDLADIESIETDLEFDVELYDGRRGDFQFGGIDAAGNVLLDSNGKQIVIAFSDIKRVEEVEDYFEWESKIDLNSSFSSGNTDSSSNLLNGAYQFKLGDRRTLLELVLVRDEVDGEPIRDSDRFNVSYNWTFNDPWFFAVNGTYDRDPIAEIDKRVSVNPGIGYDIWDEPGRFLNIQIGAGYQSETISGINTTGAVVDWRLRFTHDLFSGDLEFYHNHQLQQNQEKEGTDLSGEKKKANLVFNSTTGFRYEVTDDIYLNVELKYDLETEPADNVEGENIIFVVGAGIEFD